MGHGTKSCRAGKSIFYFGFWVLACGLSLFLFPGFCLGLVGMHLPDTVVVRLFGMVLLYLAVYYFVAGRHPEFRPLYKVTVYTRSSALVIVALLALLGMADPKIIGFVVVDALGAVWTGLALRGDAIPRSGQRHSSDGRAGRAV
jgi:uncharacterized membrane protein YfcA